MEESKLKMYCYGVVAENKALSSFYIKVTPTEMMPGIEGELKDNTNKIEVTGTDDDGNTYSSSTNDHTTISAKWLPFNSNRLMPPDMVRGEEVVIYRYANSKQYYWKETGLQDHLRRKETMTLAISGTVEPDKTLTHDNTYYLELSSHTHTITLHSSKADGELFEYTFQINGKDGCVILTDHVGNEIDLDSSENAITLKNADGSIFSLNKKNITGSCEDSMGFTATNSFSVKCKSFSVTADTATFNVPTTTFSGSVSCKSIQAGSGKIGGVSFSNGSISCSSVTSSGSITAPNLRYN